MRVLDRRIAVMGLTLGIAGGAATSTGPEAEGFGASRTEADCRCCRNGAVDNVHWFSESECTGEETFGVLEAEAEPVVSVRFASVDLHVGALNSIVAFPEPLTISAVLGPLESIASPSKRASNHDCLPQREHGYAK